MNKENWSSFLSEIIKSSINNFDMIGDNLRGQCIKYFEQLEINRDDAIGFIEEDYYKMNTVHLDSIGYTTNKLLRVRNILKRGKE